MHCPFQKSATYVAATKGDIPVTSQQATQRHHVKMGILIPLTVKVTEVQYWRNDYIALVYKNHMCHR